MRRKYSRWVLWAAVLLALANEAFWGCASTPKQYDKEASRWLAEIPPASAYPEADVLYLLDEQTEEMLDGGRGRSTVHQVLAVLRERGKDEGDFQIGYDSATQKITLIHARTISAEGEILTLRKDAMKIVTPNSQFPEYSEYKELTFSMPAVSVGCIMDVKYVVEDLRPIIPGVFSGDFLVQFMCPVLVSRYKVVAPKGTHLNFRVRNPIANGPLEPQVSQEGGKRIYLWEYRDVPQILQEDDMPPTKEVACNILVTTANTWEPFTRWWRGEIEDKTGISSGIREEVRRLTSQSADQEDKIRSIFDYVKREVRYVSVNLGKTGYTPQPAQVVFENKYGDCKDKSTLLVAMLREAGIPSFYVLIPTSEMEDLLQEFPYPFQFNHCIAAVPHGRDYIFLDPTADYSRYGSLPGEEQQRGVLVFEDEEPRFHRTPLISPHDNRNVLRQEIRIVSDGSIEVKQSRTSSGYYERIMRMVFAEFSPVELREGFEEYVSGVTAGAVLLDYSHMSPTDFAQNLSWELNYRANEYCKLAGDMLIFQLPGIGEECSADEKEERRYPIVQQELSQIEQLSMFNVPENYQVYHLPEPVHIETPYLDYRADYTLNGDQVVYRSLLSWKMLRIEPEEYTPYRKACHQVERSGKRYVLFRTEKGTGG